MSTAKRRVRLTHDHIDDHIDMSDLEALVGKMNIGPEGVTPHGRAVAAFFTWLNARNAGSSTVEYYCSPNDAAAILEFSTSVRGLTSAVAGRSGAVN
jgi:hypothetical protein